MKDHITGEVEYERLDGVIRKVSIGSDIDKLIVTQVGSHVMGTEVSSITLDRDFLNKFGKVQIVVCVRDGVNERIWKEIIDTVQIEHDLSGINTSSNGKSSNSGKQGGREAIASK